MVNKQSDPAPTDARLTDAEVETALREAERVIRLLSAFGVVRDMAGRHMLMKQDIRAMEKQKAGIQESIARLEAVKASLDKLPSEYEAKRREADRGYEIQRNALHAEFDATVEQAKRESDAQIAGFKQKIADVQAQAKRAAQELEVTKAQHADILNQLTEQIAEKQKQLDGVTKGFEDFKKVHGM